MCRLMMSDRFLCGTADSSICTRQRFVPLCGEQTSVPIARNATARAPSGTCRPISITTGQNTSDRIGHKNATPVPLRSISLTIAPINSSCEMLVSAVYRESSASFRPMYCVCPMYHMLQSMCQPM